MITIEIEFGQFIVVCVMLCAAFVLYATMLAMDVKKLIAIRRRERKLKERRKEKNDEN